MKTTWLAFILLLLSAPCFSQSELPFNSGAVLKEAIKFHDEQQYKKAIELYKTIPRNDTNYALALYEMAYSYALDSNFAAAIKTCNEVLQQDDTEQELNALILKGSTLDDMEKSEQALNIYDSALLKYPNAQNLKLNKAISLLRLKKTGEAEKILQHLVLVNPYYASAHMKLASCALQRGRIVPAMMSLFTYLLIHPGGSYHQSAIKLLSNISKNTDDVTEVVNERKQAEEAFNQIEQIVLSKMALDKNYKLQSDLDDPIIRQLQAVMEVVQYDENNSDFWMQYYVPLFKNIFSGKMLEPAVHHAFSNLTIEPVQRYIKKNGKTIKQTVTELVNYLSLISSTQELNFAKRQNSPVLYYHSENVLYAKGKLDDKEKAIGEWEYYHPNGNIRSKGSYLPGELRQGKWIFYYEDGTINGTEQWNNGMRSGEDLTYSKKGQLSTRENYLNDKLNGKKETYYATGTLKTVSHYVDGMLNGSYIEYYPSSKKHIESEYKNDKLEGTYRSYYNNGQLETEANYSQDVVTGIYKSFYDNGQLNYETSYIKGALHGPITIFHRNGKIKEAKTFQNDELAGEYKEYNEDGVLISEIFYENGLAKGLAKYFGDDGKLFCTFFFEKNVLREAKYYDKTGKEISTSIRKNNGLELTNFNPEGFKTSHAVYNDANQKTGKHSFYYNSGKMMESNDYVKGLLDGYSTGYYENGNKEYEIGFKENEKHGLSKWYYPNGTLKTKGWYAAGTLTGDWENYNEKGILSSRYSYIDGDLTGFYEINYANGKRDYEEVYYLGWLTALHSFDTSGNIIATAKFVNGKGTYTGVHPNGKKKFECNYINDELHGVFSSYFFDGSLKATKTYSYGLLDGDYSDHFHGGQIATKGEYKLGKQTGIWKYYSGDGKLWKQATYTDDKLSGTLMYYYPNGKPEYEIEYKNNERNGVHKHYSDDGQLITELYFKDDEITGYSYSDKSGKQVPQIMLPGGTGKVQAFYSNGQKSFEANYADGKTNGIYTIYYPNGKMMYQREDSYGITNNKLVEYYPDGKIKSEYNYFLDNYDGPFKEYHENGKVKEEGQFYNGYQNGIFTYYDSTGKSTSKKYFYYGLLINVTK